MSGKCSHAENQSVHGDLRGQGMALLLLSSRGIEVGSLQAQ